MPEPDRSKPCWVLMSLGVTKPERGRPEPGQIKPMRGHKLILREYKWRSGGWRRTDTPPEIPTSFNRGFAKADWIGRLPNMGRSRPAFNVKNAMKVLPLFRQGLSIREVARRTGIGREAVRKLHKHCEDL